MAGLITLRKDAKLTADGPVEFVLIGYHKGRASLLNQSPHATTITVLEPRERLRKKGNRLHKSRKSA